MQKHESGMKKKNIYLTGFMGSGKSAVGPILSRRLARRFLDTDRMVEEAAGRTVAQIFAEKGEAFFRDLESEAVRSLLLFKPGTIVAATGGGAVLREENRTALRESGLVVLLEVNPEEALERTKNKSGRPLLANGNSAQKIARLMAERESYYRQCDLSVDTTGRSPLETAEVILSLL